MPIDDELMFAEEAGQESQISKHHSWKILIVDDEEDVHKSTILALGREKICGRPLEFSHAYTSKEAEQLLTSENQFAVILLDVVMESEQAGLDLVRHIREELKIHNTRIVLRTGQPGYAPELETIAKYDINDYKSKSELTRNKLFTTLTASIRSYSQIRALEQSKKGLETIIRASKELLYLRGFSEFALGVITQLAAILELPEEGLVCVKKYATGCGQDTDLQVVAAAGLYKKFILKPLTSLGSKVMVDPIYEAANTKQNIFDDKFTCLYFETPDNSEMVVYLAAGIETRPEELQILELFSTNIAACIDNVTLLEQRHEYAYRDQLLGIPNRLSFLQSIEQHLQHNTQDLLVVLIDIDQFGALNDTIGTQNGDVLLKQVSDRLRHRHDKHLVARISGDTFGILGKGSELQPEMVSASFGAPFTCIETEHSLSATQGRVKLGQQKSATEVIAQANVALKRAKQTLRGGYQDFHNEMLKETESRVHLLQNLRHAFDQDSLFMVYQPKIHLASGKLSGFEALMRWKTNNGEFIAPLDFIPLAETSGLIVPLGEWALRTSLIKIGQLRRDNSRDLSVAVNVSVVQFAHPNFLAMLDEAIKFSGAEYNWLEIEITESFAMHDLETVQALIKEVHDRGIRVSIDDFGTGFSSLNYLEKLDVHCLKIDKSFIDRIDKDHMDTRIPETILRLGQILNLEVVAEGVETALQAKWLIENGCDYGQGYFYAKAISKDDVDAWTKKYIQNT